MFFCSGINILLTILVVEEGADVEADPSSLSSISTRIPFLGGSREMLSMQFVLARCREGMNPWLL